VKVGFRLLRIQLNSGGELPCCIGKILFALIPFARGKMMELGFRSVAPHLFQNRVGLVKTALHFQCFCQVVERQVPVHLLCELQR